jgi:hypothetical protein
LVAQISKRLRNLVYQRANGNCEYCLLPEKFSLHRHEPDHIVPVQHGGEASESNLALACFRCNRYKGPNVGSFDPETGELVPFFNPRNDRWGDHFRIENGLIIPETPKARVTVLIFKLNEDKRILERKRILGS